MTAPVLVARVSPEADWEPIDRAVNGLVRWVRERAPEAFDGSLEGLFWFSPQHAAWSTVFLWGGRGALDWDRLPVPEGTEVRIMGFTGRDLEAAKSHFGKRLKPIEALSLDGTALHIGSPA